MSGIAGAYQQVDGDLVEADRAGHQDDAKQIWQLLTLELWYRQACRAGVGV